MASYHEELLQVALDLVDEGQEGRKTPSEAQVRRSVSTIYYALFHSAVGDATSRLAGSDRELRRRRQTLARAFTHAGLRTAFDKVCTATVHPTVEDLLRPRGISGGAAASPRFAQEFGRAFSDVQAKRHEADYDLNKTISAADALALTERAQQVIAEWQAADSPADRDFKHALALLMLLRGQLRREA